MILRFVVWLALLLGIAIVGAAQSSAEKVRIANSVRSVMSEQAAAWNRGDIGGFMRGYWNSPQLVFVSGDNITRGWQSTLERYKRVYDSRAKMGLLTFTGLEITVLSRDAAVVLGSWSLARERDDPHGKFTLLFRKFPQGWLITMDHTS